MRGKAISSGERKIILNVFKHFKTENSSLNEITVITLTFKVSRIVKHGVISLTGRKNLTNWLSSTWEWSGVWYTSFTQEVKLLLIFISLRSKFHQRFAKTT